MSGSWLYVVAYNHILREKEETTRRPVYFSVKKEQGTSTVCFGVPQSVQCRLAGKLTIVVYEVQFNRREDSERLKYFSTGHSYKMESKGKDRYEFCSLLNLCYAPTMRIFRFTLNPKKQDMGSGKSAVWSNDCSRSTNIQGQEDTQTTIMELCEIRSENC